MTATSAPFAHRDFRLLQIARFLSIVALQIQSVAVGWQVYHLTSRALDLGFVGLAQFVPSAILSMFAGHTADRFDRRGILLACNLAYALFAAALSAYASLGLTSTIPIYGLLALLGVTRSFAGPAGSALLPDVVPAEEFSVAVAWSSSIWQAAMVAGPAIAGGVLLFGAAGAYACATVMAACAALCVLFMKVRTGRLETKETSAEVLLAGVRYVWNKKVILGSISLDLFAVLFGGAVALLPAFARDVLQTGPVGLGLLRAAPGVGAVITAIVLAHRPLRRRVGRVMFLCVGIFGASMIVFGESRHLWLSLVALAVSGAADMVSAVIRHTLVQVTTPKEMRGRVSAVNLVFIGASNELGEFESGITAQWLGLERSVVWGGVGTILIVLLWGVLFPSLRKVQTLEDERR
jgi:MFS family permease